jgi:hypothetical protein
VGDRKGDPARKDFLAKVKPLGRMPGVFCNYACGQVVVLQDVKPLCTWNQRKGLYVKIISLPISKEIIREN